MSQTDISISFVIPVLNGQKYMADCIEHIQREMRSQDEIIVVDNGSTDATLEILARYERVKVLNAPRITIGAARNRGAAQAKGEVLAFVDSDCLVCEGWRAAAVETLADSSVAATGSHFDMTDPPSWVELSWIPPRHTEPIATHYIPSGDLVVRKKVFDAISGFDESLITDEDTDIGNRLNEAGFVIIDAPRVRVIHLGNARTLWQFTRKEKWHATNILNTVYLNKLDKPMVMTFVFMAGWLVSLAAIPMMAAGWLSPLWAVAAIFLAPAVTALYRSYQWGRPRWLFHQVVLYFVFYLVRAIRIVEVLFTRMLGLTKE